MADAKSKKELTKIVTIPEHISYPSYRSQIDNLDKNDVVILSITVLDRGGRKKQVIDEKFILENYPNDNNITVVGRIAVNFIETLKPQVIDIPLEGNIIEGKIK